MAYSDFKTLKAVKEKFGLTVREQTDLFARILPQTPTDNLSIHLKETIPLAISINTEKARSELMITPVLLEVRRRSIPILGFFSGIDFTVDESLGLNGYCDYILSRSSDQLTLNAPVVMIAEAKNENIKNGLGQCLAAMLAAQRFNEQEQNAIDTLYGAVTTGEVWKFLMLQENIASVDLSDYYLPRDLDQILGILMQSPER